MNIIIVGCGKVGRSLVEQLSSENHDISIVDPKAYVVQSMVDMYDVFGIVGNGASYNVLTEVGVEEADLLIAVTNSDELNLLCCLIAKKAGKCATIARVSNPVYFDEINFIKEEMGISMIINPELAAASEMSRILRIPTAMEINSFAKGKVELLKFVLRTSSILNGMRIKEIGERMRGEVLVCAVERQNDVFIPSGDFVLQENDRISIVASPGSASSFFQKIGVQMNPVRNVMIVGGSKTAYYLSKKLLKMGISVKIIDKDFDRCEELSVLLPKAVIIHGNGSDQEVLLEEGLLETDAFVALTNFDEENVFLSLFVKGQTPAKLITKVKRVSYNHIIDGLDLGSLIYPEYITAQYIVQYVRAKQNSIGSNIENLYKIVDGKAEALEFHIEEHAPVIGIPLQTLPLRDQILICSINRNGTVKIPTAQDMIRVGDTVIVVTTKTGLHDISDILKKESR